MYECESAGECYRKHECLHASPHEKRSCADDNCYSECDVDDGVAGSTCRVVGKENIST